MKKKFKLRAFDSKKYFDVYVYSKLKDLREDCDEYDKKAGYELDNDDTLGVCHPFQRVRVKPDGKDIIHDNIGIIRLYKKRLSTLIVFHETMHAAFWQYRLSLARKYKEKANFGESNSDKEESFIHLAGKIYMDMIRKMYKHKYWL